MEQRPWHRHYDDGVPAELDLEPATVVDFLRRAVRTYPDRPALIFFNGRLTYRQFGDEVDRFATALTTLGVARGTRVAIQTPNLPQFAIAYYAALSLNAIASPTNPLYTPREIEHQWNDGGCEVAVITDYLYVQKIRAIRDRLPVKHYVVTTIPDYMRFPLKQLAPFKLRRQAPPLVANVPRDANVHDFRTLVRKTPPQPPAVTLELDDVATLLYTGGTTGVSKGAMLTHRNLSVNVQQLAAWLPGLVPGREVMLTMLPLFHSYGLTVAMNNGIAMGAALVLLPNPRDIPAIVSAIAKHRVTLAPAVPATYNAINQHPDAAKADLSSVKVCNSGSAPLPVEVMQRFEAITGGKITEGFGLTETAPVTHSNPVLGTRKPGSIGVPISSTDARIVDIEDGTRILPPNEVGELAVNGPQVMKGYWKRPEATAEMIRAGWLYTGDLARMDEDGFFFIEGRKKDMILCSGYNVYPDEIDRVLMSHPAVLEAGTIGVPDAKRGETVKSFVVLKPGQRATADELLTHCREELAAYKVPRTIEFMDALPKSSVLKVLRRELRAAEVAKAGR